MAYLRFSNDCDWYVFEESQKGQSESRLAVWHKDYKERGASYTAGMIRKMLESGDYSIIPGYQPHCKRILHDAFEAWLNEQSSSEIECRPVATPNPYAASIGFLEIWFAQNADDVDAIPGPFEYNPVVAGSQTIEALLEPL